ncbi:MAG: Y-family DNA polymerase [Bacteroidota bacterium]
MRKRFVCIWFPFLVTDWMERRNTTLKAEPFILYAPERGRMIVKASSKAAYSKGIFPGMVVADCRAIFPDIQVLEYPIGKAEELLEALAIWCIRFTPLTSVDAPDGIVLDCSGCTHLWQGEESYLVHILGRLKDFGYHVRGAMADTITAAWAVCHYGKKQMIVPPGEQMSALLNLPASALRLEQAITEKLEKLGLNTIGLFANMPRPSLRKRFGTDLLKRLDQAAGFEIEFMPIVQPPKEYHERLICLEPICTATGIEIGLERLLNTLCDRLTQEGKGLRTATLCCHRVDGDIQEVSVGTNLPTRNPGHLMKLFELKVNQLQPDLGFELFELEAKAVEPIAFDQTMIWSEKDNTDIAAVAELLDKIISKRGAKVVKRYLPAEHYWPERSYQLAPSIYAAKEIEWRTDLPRPIHLLHRPHVIDVTVPLPDYPPMLFFYKGECHKIKKADGPERVEQEWWLQQGEFRDYYCVEDEEGKRYWLFRSGHIEGGNSRWYIHGFFA